MSGERDRPEDFATLFERCWPRLLARMRMMMGPDVRQRADSGDVMGMLSVRILERLETLEVASESQLVRLGTVIGRNIIIDELRRHRIRHIESVSAELSGDAANGANESGPATAAERADAVERALAALETLAPEHREVIVWRSFDALSFGEIARRMDRSENAVQLLHSRALLKLGAALGQDRSA